MRIARNIPELRVLLKTLRKQGGRIGFVPTMGYLHEGHASLIQHCRARCDSVVASIFVNPTQFGPDEDLNHYPHDLDRDQALCLNQGVTILFIPEATELYTTGFSTFIDPGPMGQVLCGSYRPGHFRGVATVVAKLFSIVQPDLAFFGQKDLQQAAILRRMVWDLNLPIELVVAPTIREHDGLAMSSRNAYLSIGERMRALCISRALAAATNAFQKGVRSATELVDTAKSLLGDLDELQYCELVDALTMDTIEGQVKRLAGLCVAGKIGRARLIDNVLLSEAADPTRLLSLVAIPD
ncbi:MAG: pantoate--beta-alanine ligase [Holophagales bacterium]|jgi:pantoate--beta-alanine ligase|nr:pantoate--beta-alanine ligase [Holophagales bacterium]